VQGLAQPEIPSDPIERSFDERNATLEKIMLDTAAREAGVDGMSDKAKVEYELKKITAHDHEARAYEAWLVQRTHNLVRHEGFGVRARRWLKRNLRTNRCQGAPPTRSSNRRSRFSPPPGLTYRTEVSFGVSERESPGLYSRRDSASSVRRSLALAPPKDREQNSDETLTARRSPWPLADEEVLCRTSEELPERPAGAG
jgi:hypothetical protein